MPSIRLQESIGTITRASSTTVSLAASRINIGGLQLVSTIATTASISTTGVGGLDTGAVAANTIYYIHAVNNSGAIGLILSTSKTSPTGYSNFKWTGWVAVVNESSQVGIVADSTTWDWVAFTPTWSGTSGVAIGDGTLLGYWRRVGSNVEVQIKLTAGASTNFGSGVWRFTYPFGISFNTTVGITGGSTSVIGKASYYNGSSIFDGALYLTTSQMFPRAFSAAGSFTSHTDITSTVPFTWASGNILNIYVSFPVSGWTSTL